MKTAFEWVQECTYLNLVAEKRGNVKEMNHKLSTFLTYCEMQRDSAERDGQLDSAQYIQHIIDDLKG